MKRALWTERKFIFDQPVGWLPNVVERLHGTPVRLGHMVQALNEEKLCAKPAGTWSIKEHVGHLTDLEALHDGRIDDFLARKPVLRAADMQNIKTNQANHNKRAIETLLSNFMRVRAEFIQRLLQIDDETQLFKSMHPRLQVPMRLIDMAYFTAEHDDHHLARIRELTEILK
ncbi:MAG TPA: DinB family protein [Flavobacteriales bacterium]|nr:DinB family protein [Flavobacteriales bacterium]